MPLLRPGLEPQPRPLLLIEVKRGRVLVIITEFSRGSTDSSFSTAILDNLEKATFRLGSYVLVRSWSLAEAYVDDSSAKKVTTLRSSFASFRRQCQLGKADIC